MEGKLEEWKEGDEKEGETEKGVRTNRGRKREVIETRREKGSGEGWKGERGENEKVMEKELRNGGREGGRKGRKGKSKKDSEEIPFFPLKQSI